MSKKKNITNYTIAALLLGFTFYMYNAKPIGKLTFKESKRTEILNKFNKLNKPLNEKALQNIKTPNYATAIQDTFGYYRQVAKMPRYKSCEYLPETGARFCTNQNIQHFKKEIETLLSSNVDTSDWKISISFVVNEYAYVREVEALNNENSEISNLAIEELKKMPKFATPAYYKNKAVAVKYVIHLSKQENK